MLTLRYQPSFLPTFAGDGQLSFEMVGLDLQRELTPEQVAPQFADQLKAEQRESIQRGVTLCGPHRDELRCSSTSATWVYTAAGDRRERR